MKNNQENLQSIYKSFQLPKNDERLEKLKDSAYSKVLVITEDWCGDAMMNLPILKRVSEELNLEVRVFHRDDDTRLIDQYLTNGKSRSIPIFVFMFENPQFQKMDEFSERKEPFFFLINFLMDEVRIFTKNEIEN